MRVVVGGGLDLGVEHVVGPELLEPLAHALDVALHRRPLGRLPPAARTAADGGPSRGHSAGRVCTWAE